MEFVWVRVLPTDLQLLDSLTTDLVILLLRKPGLQKQNPVRGGFFSRVSH